MARKSIATLKAEMAALEEQISEAENRAAVRVGKLAAAEGLLDLDISDAEWKGFFKEIAGRFQTEKPTAGEKGTLGQASGQAA